MTILATDEVGKTSSITRNIVIDTESPDLTLTAPVDGEFIDSGSYTIRGQVTDNGGKGVTSLEYSTDNATWTTIPLSGFNWSVTGVDFSTGGEGNRTLYVRATDGLNPESSQQVDFYYDTADPSLSEDNYSAAQEITNGDFTFTGDVSDSNALKDTGALVITASKDGGASSQVYSRSAAQIAADGGSYSYTVVLPDDGSDDGTWVYTITATDVAGRTKSETRTFLIDETDPDTPVIDAFAGAYQVNELVSSGTAADGGSGLQTVEYSFDQSNWSPASGTSSWFRTVDISMSAANVNHRLGQGNRTLYVRAIDRAGNVSPVGSRSFTVDRADPVVTVDAEYDGTVYKNAGFTVNGTVTDSLQLAGSPIAITVDGPNTDDIALGAFNYTSGDGSWSQAVPIDDGDGSYSIAITGSDNVGRTHTVTRTVVVDTADPVVAVNNLNGDGSTQVNGATYTVSGTVTESGSGIASVEYSLDTTDGLDGTWQAATGTTSWSVALSGLTDTLTQTFAIRSTDNAGNTSAAVQREFIVDLADPVLAVTGGNTAASLVYRNSDIVLSGTATDGNGAPGVTVRYSKDGGAAVTILDGTAAQWNSGVTLQLNAGPDNVLGNGDDAFLGDGEYIFTITATDAVGKTDVETRSVRIDTLDPTAEITSLTPVTGANTVNGIITIRAAVADAIALDTLEWALVPELGDPEPAYLTVSGSKTSPEFVIDTTQTTGNVTVNGSAPFDRTLTDEAISVLYLRARDRAGNEVVISQNLEVDQASDAPVITFTTIDSSADTPEESYLNLIESNGLVRITVSDDDLVNAGSAEISIGDNASWQEINYNGGTAPASSRTVTLNHDLYSPAMLAEGTTLFYLRVSDSDAGNAKSGLPTATTTVGPVYVMVDRNFPVITETALGGDVFRSAAFSISGTISDTNALTNLTVTQSKDGGGAVTVLDQDETGTNSSFSISNMPNGGASDGEYLYTLTLTDASDKQTVLERTVIIDTTDPEAPVVTSPTAASWISGATYEFQGTASDGTGSGIDTIYVTETARGAGAPAKGDPAWQEASLESGGTQWSRTLTVAAQGERDLHVYAVDEAGNDGAITTHAFGLDTGAPVVSFDGGSGILYGNGDFTVSGTFTDTSGLSHISVESSTDDANYVAASPSSASFDGGAGTWSWTRTIGAQAEGTYYYRFNMTDLAGNLRQVTKEVNLDKTAPVIAFTSAAPSISFNAGAGSASANGTMSLSGTVTEDQNVVNLASISYQLNEGASSALAVGSSFTISGIDTTSYTDGQPLYVDVTAVDRNGNEETQRFTFNVNQATDKPAVSITSPADSTTVTTPSVTIVGEATDDDGITADPDQVQYRFSEDGTVGGYGPWQHVALGGSATVRSFSFNITASTDGAKLVQIQAYDEHGTLSDPVTLNLTFDTNEPEFTGLSPAPDSYHSGDFTLSGTAVDDTGTVDTLRYKVDRNGSQVTGWTALPGTGVDSVPFSTTIDTSFGGGTYKITLEAVDDSSATRTTTVSVFVDTADPSAAFTAPGSGSTQNNIISVSGTSDDNYGVQSLDVVVVDVNDGNTEKALPTGTLSGTSTWTVSDLDTRNATLLSYAADEGGGVYTLTLRARATDLANRTATNDLSFTIDQSTDKPVITLDSIALDGSSTITTTTINGSVTDDDGIQSIVVDTWDVGNLTATPDRSETVTLTSGSYGGTSLGWRVILADNGNGLRALRVRAVDSDDNNGSDYSASDYSRTDSGKIEFQLDTQNPDVAFTAPSANITWSSNNTFTIQGTSGDETGVTGLLLKVNDNDFSGGTTVIPDSNADDWATWTYTFNQGDLNNGPHTIYVQATDSVGNTRIASRQISVDKTAPTISVTSPANGSAVFGPLTIGGTTADNAGGAGVDAVAVGLGNQIDPLDLENSTWTSVPGTTSWSFSFLNINDYANTTYAVNTGDTNEDGIEDVGETWTDLWDFTFYVRATDKAGDGQPGNTSYLTSYTLTIDPKRDRPEISILSPEDGSTVGGYVRVFGSAFDSQFVEKVQIAIDANNDGDYTNDTWSEGTLDETDGDGVAWYLANGTTSWNVRLNEAGEFDPTGGDTTRTITFKVRAKDYKENPGDGIYGAEVEYQVTFNKDFPKIEDVSIESGSTVGGIETLTAIIRDETDIDRIVFSNEGPLLGNTTIFQNPGGLLPPGAGTTTVASTANPYGGTDITVDLLGTGDPDYQAAYPGSYRVTIPINTQAAGLYNGGAGSMSVKLSAEDVTSPSPFTNQNLISFNVDNIAPSDLSYTGSTEIIGTQAEVQGTVRDTGTISGIDRIVVYMTNADGHLIQLKNGTGAVATFTPAEIYDEDDPTFENYRIIIDNRNELGNDGAVGVGDQDGFPEYLTISGGTYNWSASFNSEDVADGAVTLHYRAEDFSGNSAEDTTGAFIANNKPSITGVVLGTDLNGNGDADDAGEKTSVITAGYGSTNFTARNDLLFVQINVTGGNNRLYYVVRHPGAALDATATVNGEMYEIISQGTSDFTGIGAASNNPGTVFTATGAGTGTGTVYRVDYTDTAIGAGSASLEINTSAWAESEPLSNSTSVAIRVFDATSSQDLDSTDELSDTITVNLDVDNVDETPAEIEVAPVGRRWDNASEHDTKVQEDVDEWSENVVTTGSGVSLVEHGYVQYSAASADAEADVSGKVILLGRAYDNQRISRITAQIPDFNGGAEFNIAVWNGTGLESAGNSIEELGTDTDESIIWGFEVVPGSEFLTQADGHVLNWQFGWNTAAITTEADEDVRVTFRIYDTNTDNDGAVGTNSYLDVDAVPYITRIYNPSGQGGLSETVIRTARGAYSLENSAGDDFRIEGFNLSGASVYVSDTAIDTQPGAGALTTSAGSTSSIDVEKNLPGSGFLTVFVNGIPSLNNLNDLNAEYNSEAVATNPRSLQWTDDREIVVWDLTEVMSGTNDQTFYYPSMVMNGNQPIFSYANDNAGYTYRTTGDDTSAIRSGAWFERHTALARTPGGVYWIASVQDAFAGGGDIGYLYINRDRARNALLGGDGSTNTNHFEIQGLDYLSTQLNRIKYPKLIVDGPDDNTNVYLSYYDTHPSAKSLSFVSFRASSATNSNLAEPTSDAGRATQVQTIPGTANASSEHFDMVKIGASDMAVVYFDEGAGTLEMQYSSNAWDANNLSGGGTWTQQTIDASPLTGSHVSTSVGTVGGTTYLYIAYQDAANTSLKLATVNWTTKAVTTQVIDSHFSVGTRTNLHILDGLPHISYSSDSYVGTPNSMRLAYPVAANSRTAEQNIFQAGADEYDQFLGNWEVVSVPTIKTPRPGIEQFHRTMIDQYNDGTTNLPVVAWLADRIEYAKMLD
ncbi:beta strand repeat-containing protein [Spirochaeta lutea]|uniref:beta strand repeat-containing protein n=1 Tax=Spirochaeta lutea TaxID=1480694 RepID=UPI000AEDEB15|nr:Ig-like domain-containing protein [Spirochaeta lutea]